MPTRLDLAGVGPTSDGQMLSKGPWLAPRPIGGVGILGVLPRACLGVVVLLCALIFVS